MTTTRTARARPTRRQPCPRTSRGQALTEFLAIVVALVPLFLLIPMLGKYQDIVHMTQQAGRYLAFDATVRNAMTGSWKTEAQSADEVRRRFFSNSDSPVKTHDTAGRFDAHRNLLWRRPDGTPLIDNVDEAVEVGFGPSRLPSRSSAFTLASDGLAYPVIGLLELESPGIYIAHASVRVADLPEGIRMLAPFDKLGWSVQRGVGLVLDPWTARDPQQAELRFGGNPTVFPAGKLSAVSPVVDAAIALIEFPGGVVGPKLGQLEFWRDVVPNDRMGRR